MVDKDIANAISSILKEVSNVTVGQHLNRLNFKVGNKVFAFVNRERLVIKLPEETIMKLKKAGAAEQLVMGKRAMREWAVIKHKSPDDYKQDLGLLKEAIDFVSKGTK